MKRQSKAALAKRKLVKATLDDGDTLYQLIDMAAESGGYEEPPGGWEVTREIEKEVEKFGRDLDKVLQQWVKKYPLKEGHDVSDLPNAEFLVFMTLRGEGVGIWDGDWDKFFNDPKKEIKALQKFLEQKLKKYANVGGSGSINEALDNAAYEQGGGDMDASALTASVMRDICATLLKGGKKTLAQRFVREVRKPKRARKPAKVRAYGGPEEEDITISPAGQLGGEYEVGVVNGPHIGRFGDMDDAVKAVWDYMKKNNYYPDVWYIDDHGGASVMTIKSPRNYTWSSFKAAVPGNLGNNTKPSTQQSQKQAVDLLKQGGILPPEEKAADYPVLTAQVKKQIIAVLLKRKQPKLATWASRNLVAAKAKRVRAAKNYAEVVFLQRDYDFKDFNGSGGRGQDGFFKSSEKEMLKYLQQWDYGDNYGEIVDPMQQKGSNDYTYKKGAYIMTYNPGLGYAGLAVKAPIGARTGKTAGSKKKGLAPVRAVLRAG